MRNANFLFIAIIAIFSACKASKNSTTSQVKTDYTIAIGDTFSINLPSNPTTGFSWKWVNKSNVAIVDTIAEQYIPTKTNPQMMGSGGTLKLTFKGLKNGLDSVKLDYLQAWNPNSISKSKTIVIEVK